MVTQPSWGVMPRDSKPNLVGVAILLFPGSCGIESFKGKRCQRPCLLVISRHLSQVKYNVYIRYNPGEKLDLQWLCRCKNGLRVVGCCSHIASIIYYLGYARFHEDPHPAALLSNIFPDSPPIVVDSDNEYDPNVANT